MIRWIVRTRIFYRLAESLVPFLSWTIITFPIWFSPFHPAIVSYFILAFLLYFLYKSIKTVYFAAVSYDLMERSSRISWHKKLQKIKEREDIIHYIIITNYKESEEKLDKTIQYILLQKYPKEKINIVLSMEEREGQIAIKRGETLKKKYRSHFASFQYVIHTLLDEEITGKASNETFAARFIDKKLRSAKIDPKKVILTVCDADSLLPDEYLAYTTLEYIKDKNRYYHFYWAPVLLYNNFWRLPLIVRVQAILSSILRLSFLSQKDDLIQISTYSSSFWLLKEVGFWDTNIIPEDWHIWLQAFFKFGEKVRTMPVYLPITRDAVLGRSLIKTLKIRYEQERRWAWGASDIPYAIKRFFETPHIDPIVKLKKILFIIEIHLLWPTSAFILSVSGFIPPFLNPVFRRTSMGFWLPKLSAFILTLSTFLILFIFYFDHKMREKIKIKTEIHKIPLLFIQWLFLPFISFIFASIPALEAHTRLLLGKKLEYKVTEKI